MSGSGGDFKVLLIDYGARYTPHPIGDSIWLENGSLVIGAGNHLHLRTRKIEREDGLIKSLNTYPHHKGARMDLFDLVSHLNGPVPVYHPQFLQQCILYGQTKLVERILLNLHKELRSYHEEIPLDNFLGIPLEVLYDPENEQGVLERRSTNIGTYFDNYSSEDELSTFGETLATSLCELLQKIPIPHLTGSEQMSLASITECVAQVNKHRRSIDENGARFLLFFRQFILGKDRRLHTLKEGGLSWREIVWAFYSDSQEILVDLVNTTHKGHMLWAGARACGLFMWLRDSESVVGLSQIHCYPELANKTLPSVNNGKPLPETTTPKLKNGTQYTAPYITSLSRKRTSFSDSGASRTGTRNNPTRINSSQTTLTSPGGGPPRRKMHLRCWENRDMNTQQRFFYWRMR